MVFMDKIMEYLLPKLTTKKVIVTSMIIMVLLFIFFPYIDTNFFYPKRIENRINVLENITKLDIEKIEKSKELSSEYRSILKEIGKSDSNYAFNLFKPQSDNDKQGKFISGAILFWVLIPMVFFIKSNQDKKKGQQIIYKILAAIITIIFSGVAGFIASSIPTIINKWVNYIGFPLILISLLVFLAYKSNNK
jgi:hypothetical protein